MHSLTAFLIKNAESLIGNPVRPTQSVLDRSDAHYYLWRKMGMSHKKLSSCSPEGSNWKSVAPASHLYTLSKSELETLKFPLDQFYLALKEWLGSCPKGLWYVVKAGTGWELFNGASTFGNVSTEGDEVEYALDAEKGLIMFLQCMEKEFPVITELCSCIVFPFGLENTSHTGWDYVSMLTVLGECELRQFQGGIVENMEKGLPLGSLSTVW